jgi:CRISPR/Cas system-associated exonuclease Cas4 (RecB family)
MENWSFSKIEATRGCKIAFEKRYINELPPDTEVPEYTEAKKIHEEIQAKFIKKQVDDYPMLKPYASNIIAVEKVYRHYFKEQDIEFVAYADVVLETEVTRVILDIKCRYNSNINERDKLQLLIYLALANQERPVAQNKAGIIVPYNQFMPVTLIDIEPPPIDFLLDEIEKAKRRIPRMTVKTSECAYCEYKRSCDYGLKEIDNNDMQAIAEKYLYLKAQVDLYEEILRKHIELTNQKIRVGDKEIGFFERAYTKVDVPEFIMLCQDNDVPYLDAVKIDTVKAKQLAKKYDILTQAMDKEIKYVFTTKKIGED